MGSGNKNTCKVGDNVKNQEFVVIISSLVNKTKILDLDDSQKLEIFTALANILNVLLDEELKTE